MKPHLRVEVEEGVVEVVPGEEVAAVVEEGEAPTVTTTLARGMATVEELVATQTLAQVVGVVAMVDVVGEGLMEHRNKAMGKLIMEKVCMACM